MNEPIYNKRTLSHELRALPEGVIEEATKQLIDHFHADIARQMMVPFVPEPSVYPSAFEAELVGDACNRVFIDHWCAIKRPAFSVIYVPCDEDTILGPRALAKLRKAAKNYRRAVNRGRRRGMNKWARVEKKWLRK